MIPSISRLRASAMRGRCSASGSPLGPGAVGVVEDGLREQPDEACRAAVVGGHREVQRHDAVAEHALADGDRLVEVGAVLVQLGDDHRARHPDRGALLPQHLGRSVDAVDGRDHEECGVGGAQTGAQVADEVGVAGGVQQVDLDPRVHERGDGEADRALLAVLGLVEVGDRGAVLDPSGPRDGACRGEQGLDQGGLACSGVADQDHVAHGPGLVGLRCTARGSGTTARLDHQDRLLALSAVAVSWSEPPPVVARGTRGCAGWATPLGPWSG